MSVGIRFQTARDLPISSGVTVPYMEQERTGATDTCVMAPRGERPIATRLLSPGVCHIQRRWKNVSHIETDTFYIPIFIIITSAQCCIALALHGGEWSGSCSGLFNLGERTPSMYWIESWAGPDPVWMLWSIKNLFPLPGIQPRTPSYIY